MPILFAKYKFKKNNWKGKNDCMSHKSLFIGRPVDYGIEHRDRTPTGNCYYILFMQGNVGEINIGKQ